jgi:hypothetical protein
MCWPSQNGRFSSARASLWLASRIWKCEKSHRGSYELEATNWAHTGRTKPAGGGHPSLSILRPVRAGSRRVFMVKKSPSRVRFLLEEVLSTAEHPISSCRAGRISCYGGHWVFVRGCFWHRCPRMQHQWCAARFITRNAPLVPACSADDHRCVGRTVGTRDWRAGRRRRLTRRDETAIKNAATQNASVGGICYKVSCRTRPTTGAPAAAPALPGRAFFHAIVELMVAGALQTGADLALIVVAHDATLGAVAVPERAMVHLASQSRRCGLHERQRCQARKCNRRDDGPAKRDIKSHFKISV